MEIELKTVQNSDWDAILELRNDFYQNFYLQKEPIPKQEHYQYLKEQQANPNFHHWMIMADNKIAGYVRIKENDIGIIVKKDFQNLGIGSISLKLAEQKAKELGLTKLIGLIKVKNLSSEKAFRKNNYELKMLWFEKNLK